MNKKALFATLASMYSMWSSSYDNRSNNREIDFERINMRGMSAEEMGTANRKCKKMSKRQRKNRRQKV